MLLGNLAGCAMNKENYSSGKNNSKNQTITNNDNNKNQNTANNNNGSKEPEINLVTIKEYFPMKKNTRYIYEGAGNEFASFDVYNDYISGNKVQQRINNGGTTIVQVLELSSGKLSKVFSKGEAYYRENRLNENAVGKEILLMEPLKKGTTWKLNDGRKRTITNTAVDLTTKTGNYKALEVTTESTSDKTIDYYAPNVGLVKSILVSGETQISSTLADIEENVPLVQKINFYYPNSNDEKIYYKKQEISFYTNEITRKVLGEAYKKAPTNELGRVFSDNTKINSLYLNRDGMVYIDLNHAFIDEMSAGARYEAMILQCIVNTVGQYYQSEKVYLTIENKPYESGHILMGKGEFFKVQTQNLNEIQ